MPRRQPLTAAAGALAAAAVLASCGRSVDVAPPPADPSCAAVIAALPPAVAGEQRRDVAAAGAAAWGDPPIVARCGVGMPAAYEPTSQLLDVDGIAWLAEDAGDGAVRFTSVRTSPRIEVTVPAAQGPASDALVDIAAAVAGSR